MVLSHGESHAEKQQSWHNKKQIKSLLGSHDRSPAKVPLVAHSRLLQILFPPLFTEPTFTHSQTSLPASGQAFWSCFLRPLCSPVGFVCYFVCSSSAVLCRFASRLCGAPLLPQFSPSLPYLEDLIRIEVFLGARGPKGEGPRPWGQAGAWGLVGGAQVDTASAEVAAEPMGPAEVSKQGVCGSSDDRGPRRC